MATLLPYLLVLAAILGMKAFCRESILASPRSHPYAVSFFGRHVLINAYVYLVGMLQSFLPMGAIQSTHWRVLASTFVASVLVIGRARGKRGRKDDGGRSKDQFHQPAAGSVLHPLSFILHPCLLSPPCFGS